MTVSLPFQQQFTWRKLGFLYFTNSLEYRAVLEQNPQWKVTELPPVGAQIRLSPTAQATGNPGGLTQGSFVFGQITDQDTLAIFPFNSLDEYKTALNRYTIQGVIDREKNNGVTFDSNSAITGIQ